MDPANARGLRQFEPQHRQLKLTGTVRPLRPAKSGSASDRLGFELLGGAQFDPGLIHTSGLLGPRVGIAAVIRERFVASALVGMSWVLGAPNHYAMRDNRAGLGIDWRGSEHLSLGMTAMLTAIHVSAPQGLTRSSPWSLLEPACQVHLGYRSAWKKLSLEMGPTLTVYAHPRIVRQDSSEVLALPVLLFGIVAQTAYRF